MSGDDGFSTWRVKRDSVGNGDQGLFLASLVEEVGFAKNLVIA